MNASISSSNPNTHLVRVDVLTRNPAKISIQEKHQVDEYFLPVTIMSQICKQGTTPVVDAFTERLLSQTNDERLITNESSKIVG